MKRDHFHNSLDGSDQTAQYVRILMLMAAASRAGLDPVTSTTIHSLAYLTNVLSPVWKLPVQDAQLLKSRGGAYYPGIQRGLDQLVAAGLLSVHDLTFEDTLGGVRFNGEFRLKGTRSKDIIDRNLSFGRERRWYELAVEIALALSASPSSLIPSTTAEDMTMSDAATNFDRLIDLSEQGRNPTSELLKALSMRTGRSNENRTSADEIHLYLDFLRASARRVD